MLFSRQLPKTQLFGRSSMPFHAPAQYQSAIPCSYNGLIPLGLAASCWDWDSADRADLGFSRQCFFMSADTHSAFHKCPRVSPLETRAIFTKVWSVLYWIFVVGHLTTTYFKPTNPQEPCFHCWRPLLTCRTKSIKRQMWVNIVTPHSLSPSLGKPGAAVFKRKAQVLSKGINGGGGQVARHLLKIFSEHWHHQLRTTNNLSPCCV